MARSLLDHHLNQVRRRLVLDKLLGLVAWAWVIALALGVVWLVIQPLALAGLSEAVRWGVLGGFALVATAAAIALAVSRAPTPVVAALALDERFGLKERVTSSLTLGDALAATPAGKALLADVEDRLASVRVRDRFPVAVPRAPLAVLPVAGLALALVALFWNPTLDEARAEGDEPGDNPVAKEDVDQQMKKLLAAKPKAKKPEDPANAAELEKIQADIEKFSRGTRQTEEQVRERIKDATAIEEAIARQQKEHAERVDAFKEQMKQLDRLARKDRAKDEAGPAKKAADAMARGDMQQTKDELAKLSREVEKEKAKEEEKERLKRKKKDPATSEAEKKKAEEDLDKLEREQNMTQKDRDQLAKQLEAMEDQLERLSRSKEEQAKDLKDKADAGEIDKDQLDRELDQLQKNGDKFDGDKESMKEMAKQLGECRKCMKEGKDGEAADKLSKAAEQAGKMGKDGQDEAMAQRLAQVRAAKKALCKSLSDKGGPGEGKRPMGKDEETGHKELADPGEFGKGKLEVVGSGPMDGFKGPRKPGEMQEEIRQATQEAPAAIDRQRLPPAARKMARGYFEKVRGPEADAKAKK
jgi:hypothetical protein